MKITTTMFARELAIAGAVCLAVLFAIALLVSNPFAPKAVAGGQVISCTDLTRTSSGTAITNGCLANGTTTPVFLTAAAATTTMTVATGNAAYINLNVDTIASSSASAYTFAVQYSNNGQDWYGEDSSATASSVTTHAAAQVLHTFTPGTTAETRRSLNIPTHGAKYTRFGFQVNAANGSLYPQAIITNAVVN